jgi:hypothetical protein
VQCKTIALTTFARSLENISMKVKRTKIIRIEKIMPKRIQKQTGLYKLSPTELANLNAWLNFNLAKARDVLPVSPPPPAF